MLDKPFSEVECQSTGNPLHSPVSLPLPLPRVTVFRQVSTDLCYFCIGHVLCVFAVKWQRLLNRLAQKIAHFWGVCVCGGGVEWADLEAVMFDFENHVIKIMS